MINREGARRDKVPTPSANLTERQTQLREISRGGLRSLTTGRPEFVEFTDAGIVDTADSLVRNGAPPHS